MWGGGYRDIAGSRFGTRAEGPEGTATMIQPKCLAQAFGGEERFHDPHSVQRPGSPIQRPIFQHAPPLNSPSQ